ncbi:sigma-54-dependent transcriptional regulator [Desulfogranum japonicum]|uniref:sigma-54-dependent transcriptional regulator n=1 Tax=Desulfogranum japonicum TaxID=231447 RepID=UPI001969F3BC|nr:sigma-54 dependent transcriptional regulator [Desulfogranum japonicum]
MMQHNRRERITTIVADDDLIFCKQVQRILQQVVDRLFVCHTGQEVFETVTHHTVDIVLLDLQLPDMDGLKILDALKRTTPDIEVIIITGHSSIDSAVDAIRTGACHYLRKPVKRHDLLLAVQAIQEKVLLKRENDWLRQQLECSEGDCGILGQSPPMETLIATIKTIAPLDCNVLIQGETGTGKQLVAKAVHQLSHRNEQPFIAFNCGAFAEELVANELFGHEKGAYTGATTNKIGLLEAGNNGTVFLDEIGEMDLSMQVKLLHVLEEKRILRIGGTTPVDLNIRIIAATNRDLKEMVSQGTFREDLFFRLNVVVLELPALSDRKEDLPLLISHFLAKYNRKFNKAVQKISQNAMEILAHYDYPGNIRELENIIQRAVALGAGDTVEVEHLPLDIQHCSFETADSQILKSLAEVEKEHISRVLRFTRGDRKMAAAILGLPRTTLWRRIKQHKLDDEDN